MEILAGTALLALCGRLCAERSRRMTGTYQSARLFGLVTLVLALPVPAAPGVIGLGWLLSLTAGHRRVGWDLFAAGCGLLGRSLISTPATLLQVALCLLMLLLGWVPTALPQAIPSFDGRRLGWELSRARQAIAPLREEDAWRCRAADALARAFSLARTLGPRRSIQHPDRTNLRRVLARSANGMLCLGAAALGDGDPATALSEFAAARRAITAAAGDGPDGREELERWHELIDWCEIAATLIDEEALQ